MSGPGSCNLMTLGRLLVSMPEAVSVLRRLVRAIAGFLARPATVGRVQVRV